MKPVDRIVRPTRRGLSLLEVVISSWLVGSVLVGSMMSLANWRRMRHGSETQEIATRLAHELVNEISSVSFSDPASSTPTALGREAGESATSRSNWNDIDDYHLHSESPLKAKDGVVISGTANYQRSVVIAPAVISSSAPGFATTTDVAAPMRHVTVTVVAPTGKSFVAQSLVSNVTTKLPGSYHHRRSMRINLSSGGQTVSRTVATMNHPAVTP